MNTAALISVEEYLRLSEKPYREYRDGVLLPKPMPTKLHGLVEFLLVAALRQQGLDAAPEVSLRMSATKVLIPDVVADRSLQSPYPTEPVLLCCEVLSAEDRLGATLAKCEEYHAWGVPYCWMVDPEKRTAWEYHRDGEPVRVTEFLHAGDVQVSVPDLFASLPA